jgi:hypothetical protein
MSKENVTVSVNVGVDVQVDAHISATPTVDNSETLGLSWIGPVALLGVVGAIAGAIVMTGVTALIGLAGVVGVGTVGFIAYDHLPDLLNDWHYRRVLKMEMRAKALEAQRPVIIMVASQEDAHKLMAGNTKYLVQK